ncbi:MAG TPA: hypothetical protein VJQ25_01775, partial [Nitrospira sp.]|nr:hypothetical protein [Nitrospira sp.]
GNQLYFRYRWGHFEITLVDDPELSSRYDWGDWIELYDEQRGHDMDGVMSNEELFAAVPEWLTFSDDIIEKGKKDDQVFDLTWGT